MDDKNNNFHIKLIPMKKTDGKIYSILYKLIKKLDKFSRKLEKMTVHLEKGYNIKEYDEDYKSFYKELAELSNIELEREKFLAQSIIHAGQKKYGYSEVAIIISEMTLGATVIINIVNLYLNNVELTQISKMKVLLLFAACIVFLFVSLMFCIFLHLVNQSKYNYRRNRCRLKIKIIDNILFERKRKYTLKGSRFKKKREEKILK